MSVSEPDVAFPTPATSPPAAPGGRYFASAGSSSPVRQIFNQAKHIRVEAHTRCSLLPRGIQCLAEDFCASDRNLHDDLWRRLHPQARHFSQSPRALEGTAAETYHARDDGDSSEHQRTVRGDVPMRVCRRPYSTHERALFKIYVQTLAHSTVSKNTRQIASPCYTRQPCNSTRCRSPSTRRRSGSTRRR